MLGKQDVVSHFFSFIKRAEQHNNLRVPALVRNKNGQQNQQEMSIDPDRKEEEEIIHCITDAISYQSYQVKRSYPSETQTSTFAGVGRMLLTKASRVAAVALKHGIECSHNNNNILLSKASHTTVENLEKPEKKMFSEFSTFTHVTGIRMDYIDLIPRLYYSNATIMSTRTYLVHSGLCSTAQSLGAQESADLSSVKATGMEQQAFWRFGRSCFVHRRIIDAGTVLTILEDGRENWLDFKAYHFQSANQQTDIEEHQLVVFILKDSTWCLFLACKFLVLLIMRKVAHELKSIFEEVNNRLVHRGTVYLEAFFHIHSQLLDHINIINEIFEEVLSMTMMSTLMEVLITINGVQEKGLHSYHALIMIPNVIILTLFCMEAHNLTKQRERENEKRENEKEKKKKKKKQEKRKRKETRDKRQETRDKRQETRDKRQETRDKRQETRDKRQETRDKRQETRDKRQETRDKRQETRDKRQETRDKRQETRDKRQDILKRKASFLGHIARGSAGEELKMIIAEGWRKVRRGRRIRRWMDDVELLTRRITSAMKEINDQLDQKGPSSTYLDEFLFIHSYLRQHIQDTNGIFETILSLTVISISIHVLTMILQMFEGENFLALILIACLMSIALFCVEAECLAEQKVEADHKNVVNNTITKPFKGTLELQIMQLNLRVRRVAEATEMKKFEMSQCKIWVHHNDGHGFEENQRLDSTFCHLDNLQKEAPNTHSKSEVETKLSKFVNRQPLLHSRFRIHLCNGSQHL
ncbi:Polysialic acid O-acetyltransferase [Nymphon striatum]|nr:Polysialic acid O-acetyltransferase [Nymphon striatum]